MLSFIVGNEMERVGTDPAMGVAASEACEASYMFDHCDRSSERARVGCAGEMVRAEEWGLWEGCGA